MNKSPLPPVPLPSSSSLTPQTPPDGRDSPTNPNMPLQNSRSVSPGRGVMMKGTVRGKQRTGKKNRGGGEEGVDEKKDDRVGREENGGKGKGKKIRGKGRR